MDHLVSGCIEGINFYILLTITVCWGFSLYIYITHVIIKLYIMRIIVLLCTWFHRLWRNSLAWSWPMVQKSSGTAALHNLLHHCRQMRPNCLPFSSPVAKQFSWWSHLIVESVPVCNIWQLHKSALPWHSSTYSLFYLPCLIKLN